MGISIQEFRIAMETYGAKRLADRMGSRYRILVPCFQVADVDFLHSGSYYIVQRTSKVSDKIMNQAMAEFGEQHPGGNNFWWGEIHSVKGIITLALMLENKYSKELAAQLTNETYKKLLQCSLIQQNVDIPVNELHSSKFEELIKLVKEFDDIVNPFGNINIKKKEPIQYLDKVSIGIDFSEIEKPYAKFCLSTQELDAKFNSDSNGWSYSINIENNLLKGQNGGYTFLGHYYSNGRDFNPVDETIYLDYTTGRGYLKRPGDIDLRISLKTGLAWETYKEEEATLATDEQIQTIINYLKLLIEKAKREITDNMVN